MDGFALWQRTLADQADVYNPQREILRQAFLSFRDRAVQLVGEIAALLPELTVHDITHLDALWRVADQIAGPDYPLNPAEAFVLGGAFLLHDAAHVLVAYEDGVAGVKRSVEWKDLIAQRFDAIEPATGSPEEHSALFQVLRHLHAKQARHLAKLSWKVPSTGEQIHLLEHFQLRDYYGDLIGEIAESHHWPSHRVAETWEHRHVNAPAFLAPAGWDVDALKVAFLLRTADAAHIDGQRAPWFLFALRRPDEISRLHWQFQAKMGQLVRTDRGELRWSSGSPFDTNDRQAWWLAYDVACMIDREVRDVHTLMRDTGRTPFATVSVEHVASPEAFATNVRTGVGWEPVNVAPKIGDVPNVIASLGGAKLYGDRPELALRELIQNAADAVRALRALGEIGQKEGEIEVSLEPEGDVTWLHVTDTGIGMSRFVLTEVLLDFGNSLWSGESMRNELPGLAAKGFKAVGRFGIGFFSVFMLGSKVRVTTRRFSRTRSDDSDQWLLDFSDGLEARPTLLRPNSTKALRRAGTRVSVVIDQMTIEKLLIADFDPIWRSYRVQFGPITSHWTLDRQIKSTNEFRAVVAKLCPTLDVKVRVRMATKTPVTVVAANDWQRLKPLRLLQRASVGRLSINTERLIELRETSGALLGRIAYVGSYYHAVITYGGIRSGIVPKLAGILLGENNSDLARLNSRPMASSEAWRRWAEKWIDSCFESDAEALADLHPLCPERDLAVYRIESKQLGEAQLIKWLRREEEVCVLAGCPSHEDYDDVSSDTFRDNFELSNDILVIPSSDRELAKSLSLPLIDYTNRLEIALRAREQRGKNSRSTRRTE